MSIDTDPPAGGGSAASVGGPVIFTLARANEEPAPLVRLNRVGACRDC